MAIVFPNNTISELSGGRITYPNNIIQIVDQPFTSTYDAQNWATQNEIAVAKITPTSVNSKILVYVNIHFRGYDDIGAGTWNLAYIWVRENTRNVELMRSGWNGTWRRTISNWSKSYLDSPNSTSQQVYSLRVGNHPTGLHYFNQSGQNSHDGLSFIRLIEFGA